MTGSLVIYLGTGRSPSRPAGSGPITLQGNSTEPRQEEYHRCPPELDISDALSLAVRLQRAGHLDDAQTLYQRVLLAAPDHADALHFLGVLEHQRGHTELAIELINRSITLSPEQADRYNNLGNVLFEAGQAVPAMAAYRRAIELAPSHADAHNNLGAVLRSVGHLEEARAAYQKAIELNPVRVDAYNNLGNLLSSQGRTSEAVTYYCKAITLMPEHSESKRLLGIAYSSLGQIDAAAEVFRQWLLDEPENPVAKHMYAACSGHAVPSRASDAYIEATFDSFAATFDAKLSSLVYRAPQLIVDALTRTRGAPARNLVAVDAGCGTGLCGALLAPYVSHITGVDLSDGMLARARRRGVYDELVKAELCAYLCSLRDAVDLIVAADTLVYFGPLDEVLAAASTALRTQGLLIFTLEQAEEAAETGPGYRINPHGRYSHSRRYVTHAMEAAVLTPLTLESAVLRNEAGRPVAGLVATARLDRE